MVQVQAGGRSAGALLSVASPVRPGIDWPAHATAIIGTQVFVVDYDGRCSHRRADGRVRKGGKLLSSAVMALAPLPQPSGAPRLIETRGGEPMRSRGVRAADPGAVRAFSAADLGLRDGDRPACVRYRTPDPGAQKAGTTALYAYLRRHPSITGPSWKEVELLRPAVRPRVAWYRGNFPRCARRGRIVVRRALAISSSRMRPSGPQRSCRRTCG